MLVRLSSLLLPVVRGFAGRRRHRRILATLAGQYDCRLMSNVNRGVYIECLIADRLGATLSWTAHQDAWASFDMELDGVRIEVKQSAAMQPWHIDRLERTGSPRFGIAPTTGYWTPRGDWIQCHGRHADIHIFAWHGERRQAYADHRSGGQWLFYVIPTARLPEDRKSIGFSGLAGLTEPVDLDRLPGAVRTAIARVRQSLASSSGI